MKANSSAKKGTNSVLPGNKAHSDFLALLHSLPDAIISTDLVFTITGWNDAAEKLHGLPGAAGQNLFQLIKIDLPDSSFENVRKGLLEKGNWQGEVIFHRHDGEKFIFNTTANTIYNEYNHPVSYIFVSHNITKERNAEIKLADAEATYEKLVNTMVDGVMMIGRDGNITTCNKRASQILGIPESELLKKNINNTFWIAVKQDGAPFPHYEFPAIVSLQTGFPQRNVKMGIKQPEGSLVWVSVNSEALIRAGEFEPYAVFVSFSDITESVIREEELRRSNERFYYISNITSDAIWDLDLTTQQIYRSETFSDLSGYSPENTQSDLDWWFSKVHPEDRQRVRDKVNDHIQKGYENWEDEYRFLCADGNYKNLLDTGIILYRYGKPVRVLGAIRDLTEKKKLEQELRFEQEQKLKAISLAVIASQEQERSNISRELHDNVNQILMSAKMFMNAAKNNPDKFSEHLDTAINYQGIAVEEIRKLSHRLNSSLVRIVGLNRSLDDLGRNLSSLQAIQVNIDLDKRINRLLSDDQQLMIYRIVQEQTNNILKYAEARKVKISINIENNFVYLSICDDGKGFDTSIVHKGIGLINIYNRAEAFGGEAKLETSPGNGCTLKISFPLEYK